MIFSLFMKNPIKTDADSKCCLTQIIISGPLFTADDYVISLNRKTEE